MAAVEKLAALDAEDYIRSRVARADLATFDRIMSRAGGELPREGMSGKGVIRICVGYTQVEPVSLISSGRYILKRR